MHAYLRYAKERRPDIVRFIRSLVEIESPSDSPASVNRLCEWIVAETRDIARPRVVKAKGFGNHLRLEFTLPGRRKSGQVLGLGHSDTVWPLGTLARMPFRSREGRLWGPGVLDMKAGLAFYIYATRLVRDLDVAVPHKVVLLIVSDEEIGSKSSRPVVEAEAKRSDYVLVVEPGTGLTGKLKTARKGVGHYVISITGKPSHAGIDFAAGASAILEAARQVERVASFTNLPRGITVNPGVIRGGTRSNVVAAEAQIEVDIRIARLRDAASLDKKFRTLRPVDKRCSVEVEGSLNRPPMERTNAIARLFGNARKLAAELNVQLEESSTGGGSDGNFTAGLGVPTLDGLGAVGEGAHATNESILIDRIPDRVALLAMLLTSGAYGVAQ
ncbi:MAG: M20 family metallopeptidase [Bryobacteraceae bacterium]